MTRQQKIKLHFDRHPNASYVEFNENDRLTYKQFPDGDWKEYEYDENHRHVFLYSCWKTKGNIKFMNIICPR